MIPAVAAPSQRFEDFAEAVLRLAVCQLQELVDDFPILIRTGAVAIDRTHQPDGAARLPLASGRVTLPVVVIV